MTSSRFLIVLLIAAGCTPPAASLSDADRKAIDNEVRAANMALVDAQNAHDAPGVLAFYEAGPQFQYVGCTNLIPTADVFRSIITGYHNTRPEVTYEMAVTRIEVLNRDAVVATLQGESDSLKLFTTRVWRRSTDDLWKIAYEHESWPGCAPPRLPHVGTTPGDTRSMNPDSIGG